MEEVEEAKNAGPLSITSQKLGGLATDRLAGAWLVRACSVDG